MDGDTSANPAANRVAGLPRPVARELLGAILTRRARLSPVTVAAALDRQRAGSARIGEILCAEGVLHPDALADALAFQHGLEWVDLAARPPDPRAASPFDPETCLRHGFVPAWRDRGALVVATAWPDRLATIAAALPPGCGPVRLAYASEAAIQGAIARLWRDRLARAAETRCPRADSCRGWTPRARRHALGAFLLVLAGLALAGPAVAAAAGLTMAVLALIAGTGLKLVAFLAVAGRASAAPDPGPAGPLPRISLLIPLLRESAILPDLLARLERLDYPAALIDACLVVEADDAATRAALSRLSRPAWLRVIAVPPGAPRTKPRALNYALGFCRGEVVGVWDAEDAPDPAQLRAVAARFGQAGPDLACVQGILDYYNSRANPLARCFTIEYAVWFRVVLRGLSRLGLPFPLGGTTMFIRRDVLEAAGGWDAHNVTEDADLGIRLTRLGYRREVIDSVTREEANCRLLPWLRQRARWMKGFAMTWATHMRRPARLWRELGPAGFLTFQALFAGTLLGFMLAPLLWSFWLVPFTGTIPLAPWLPPGVQLALFIGFLLAEAINLTIAWVALGRRGHRGLRLWIPAMHLYFPLGTFAAWRAGAEWLIRPYHWSKTPHGIDKAGRARGAPGDPDAPTGLSAGRPAV